MCKYAVKNNSKVILRFLKSKVKIILHIKISKTFFYNSILWIKLNQVMDMNLSKKQAKKWKSYDTSEYNLLILIKIFVTEHLYTPICIWLKCNNCKFLKIDEYLTNFGLVN